MNVLALDTCLGACSAAVLVNGRIAARRRELMQRGHAEMIAPMVQDVVRDAGLAMADITRIGVTVGPGSFTGVRIGLSLAQGLGLALKVPVIGLDTMTATAAPLLGTEAVTVCHAAGATGQYFVRHFSGDGTPASDILLLRPDQLHTYPGQLVIGGAAAAFAGAKRDEFHDLPDAALFAPLTVTFPDLGMPRPVYVREADAKPLTAKTLPSVPALTAVSAAESAVLAGIHAQSFAESWTAADIAALFETGGTQALLASNGNEALGFILIREIAGEAEILTLCCNPAARRQGVARALLKAAVARLRAENATTLFLEVAADNEAAIALYRKSGFAKAGLRKNYYQRRSTQCDALIMRLPLP